MKTRVVLKSQALIDLFDADECLFLGDAMAKHPNGALCTREQYENLEMNPCHLNGDGTITRFHEVIGTIADIEFQRTEA